MARILVVDDEPLVGKTIERALSKVGHTVLRATTKEEFLDCLNSGPFDLLVLDIHMPDMGPEEVISKVKAGNPALTILVVSGSNETRGYMSIQKPFKIDELRQKVKELLDATGV